ncbi:MAG: hypothetical protein Q9M36_00215 [Sulfurovum sp.]|nr:hypothetical protein [Sulfurovum sp.]
MIGLFIKEDNHIYFKNKNIHFLVACTNVQEITHDAKQKNDFDRYMSAKRLYTTYHKFLKNPNFWIPKYSGISIGYFNSISIFYSSTKDHTYTFTNEVTKEEARRLKKLYRKKLALNILVSKYIYEVVFAKGKMLKSTSSNEELFFDDKGRIIISIYSSGKESIRFIPYLSTQLKVPCPSYPRFAL